MSINSIDTTQKERRNARQARAGGGELSRAATWLLAALLLRAVGAWADDEKPKPSPVAVTASREGFVLRSEDGEFKLQLRGLVQLDARFYPSSDFPTAIDTFIVRRARIIFVGTVAKYFDFNFTPDFAGGNTTIQDFYVNAKGSPRLQARAGKFKPPIGIEHLQGDAYLAFPERAFPASLEPNRDVGLQLHGELGKGVVTYAAGIFDGAPDGASVDQDVNDSKDVVGRLFFSPFRKGKSVLKGLGFGVSASTGRQTGPLAILGPYRTGGQLLFYNYVVSGVNPAGTRTRFSFESSLYAGPLGVLAEYVQSKGRLQKTGTSQFDSLANDAWQTTATFFLTGDVAAYSSVDVKRPLNPSKGQWGALQLAARINGFKADPTSFTLGYADITKSASKATAVGIALNWFPNGNFKETVSYERTTFVGGAANGDRKPDNTLILRTELGF
jgi:phosphate-selective porin OprO/OprP